MRYTLVAVLVLAGTAAFAAPGDVGDVAVVQDTDGSIHSGFGLQQSFCRETAKRFLQTHADEFDGLVTFTVRALSDLENVQQGTPVIWSTQGIGTTPHFDNSAQYGSNHKLSQCVFMGSLAKLPTDPDGPVKVFFGLPLGVTGVELVGHEYGHHWLNWIYFDKNDGQGKRHLLRGFEDGNPNGHYNHYADSHSVMYGSFITDHGNGQFTLAGGDRKYGALDQYLMGLRDASEVPPIFYIDDGSGEGSPAVPLPKGQTGSASGTRVDVTIDDVIRAMGTRVPSVATSQKCWRVAFVLVGEGNTPPSTSQVAMVESYRKRFSEWFTWATDGRGTMDTRLNGTGCLAVTADAGTPMMDAGVQSDAGSMTMDAGISEMLPDSGCSGPGCGGMTDTDAGTGGVPQTPGDGDDIGKLSPGCGCATGTEATALAAMVALAFALSRARRSRWR